MDGRKKVLIAHPTGNENTRHAVLGLYAHGMLQSFHTCVACFEGSLLYGLSAMPFFRIFRRRVFDSAYRDCTHTYPWRELGRQIARVLRCRSLTAHEKGPFCVDEIYRNLDRRVSYYLQRYLCADAVYGYEDCALQTFQAAKQLHKSCIYDLPIGYWRSMRKLLEAEKANHPDWAVTLGSFDDSEEKLQRKDQELALADKIYVASTFTKKTLDLFPGKLAEVEVIPYGFPPVNRQRVYQPFEGRKVKALFVGGLSQRKGIAYLFEACRDLGQNIELTVVGTGNAENCPALRKALRTVNYIPALAHEAVLDLMATQDLLIFPSLFEGFGLVVTEAMSQGTPVITTERTCGPDVITHGLDGWIVQAGSAESLRGLLERIIADPAVLKTVGQNAMRTASQRPWSCYEAELGESVNNFLNAHTTN